jgi:hypothetical protein
MSWITKGLAAALTGAFAICSMAQGSGPLMEEAKITINSGAQEDGSLTVRVTPANGAAKEVTVALKKGMGENAIAEGIASALRPVLAPTYEADKDAGEHVKIRKADRSAASFSVAVMFNVPGFSVVIDK